VNVKGIKNHRDQGGEKYSDIFMALVTASCFSTAALRSTKILLGVCIA
jgi:hypothetical protein